MAVVVVTDSSARLRADEVRAGDIRVVPLHILVDGRDLRDGVDAVPADLYQRGHVTTAGATPSELAATYRDALRDSGGDGVVAVHISGELSSTLGAAEYAAREFGGPCGWSTRSRPRWAPGSSQWPPPVLPSQVRTWKPLLPRRNQQSPGCVPTLSSSVWTTCGVAAGSAPPRHGSAPRWPSSHCCASTSRVGWCWLSGCAPHPKRKRRWSSRCLRWWGAASIARRPSHRQSDRCRRIGCHAGRRPAWLRGCRHRRPGPGTRCARRRRRGGNRRRRRSHPPTPLTPA